MPDPKPEQVVIGVFTDKGKMHALTMSAAALATLVGMTQKCSGSVRLVATIGAAPAVHESGSGNDWRGQLADRLDRYGL